MEAVLRGGHCYRQAGDRELATDLLNLALMLAELRGDPDAAGRATIGLGTLSHNAGDLPEAERLYHRALELGRQANDLVLIGETEQNLGVLANVRGNLTEAQYRYEAALEHLERAGLARGRIASLNNLGMLHVDLGRLEEADDYFRKALAIAEEVGDVVRAGVVHINRAELFLARGELQRARESCDEGFEIFSRVNHPVRKAEALKFYGAIYRESGKLHLAEIHLRQAIEIAQEEPLLEAETQREMARVQRAQGRNREALEALNRSHLLFTRLQAQAEQADIDKRIEELEADFLSLVRFWGESIEAKDRYTMGHCARVADYACRIAERAGRLTPREMVWFRMGAFLHDVGKTEVPAEILNKPGRLTDEERALMERHTVIGDEMLAPVEFPWDIRPMVRSHHERWDGRGYPDRLVAGDIPYSARILRIADVFDALTTARSYRAPLTPDEALAIMVDDEGSFDPELFVLFRELFDELAPTAVEAAFAGSE
ncbi:HD domain-containing phosphohydrolase [Longimicrobium sp.]|uniref:HD domain-containing phosphohydrolase n=1 Tax=Longimicrobium sp. TaxID=2029185 RepID=UPI002E37E885|nr:HD domain-containing phosphohydrolase [Longimicrobium sp.]HEX6039984.1 HD domain-containing phosphohydrolase [Longimicrobium sp.]